MRRIGFVLLFAFAFLLSPAARPLHGQTVPNLSGKWLVSLDAYGYPLYLPLELKQEGDKLTGTLGEDKLEGTVSGGSVHFLAKGEEGGTGELTATVQGDGFSGTAVFTEADNPTHPVTNRFIATRIPPRPSGPPKRHEFVPTTFYRAFSAAMKPVLTISPGDTVHTTTVDAGGTDEKSVNRVLGGNPETGPFYIESAMPGDTLVVHLNRVRLNRDWAISDDAIVDRGMDSDLAVRMKDAGKSVRWHLDMARGVAMPEKPGEHITRYTVPLRPMLGCIATAANAAQSAPPSGDSGRYGGNMDFNEIVEGATVYLPVNVPGALFYLGDGHAAQGDGELNGNALETSMDVEFTVDVLPGKRLRFPRVESDTHIMAMGLGGSLDDAFRSATGNMAAWLSAQYKLTPSEVAQVLGTSAEYKVTEVADRNAGIVLKINKERLQALTPAAK